MEATSPRSFAMRKWNPEEMNSAAIGPGGRITTSNGIDETHPFELWVAGCLRDGAVEFQGDDVILGEKAAARFAPGVDREKRMAVLGIVERDAEPLRAMPWTSAALLAGVNGREWIALSARDARIGNARELSPKQLRLFIPLDLVVYEAVKALPDGKIQLVSLPVENGRISAEGRPLMSLPFKKIGVA
jgi:hypothetical protein